MSTPSENGDRQLPDSTITYRSFEAILDRCLRVTKEDEILVIHDESLAPYLADFLELIARRGFACTLLEFPREYQLDLVRRGKHPARSVRLPQPVAGAINEASVILSLLGGEMETGQFRGAILDRVRQKGSRLAHVPGFDDEILRITGATPIEDVLEDCEAVAWALGECRYAELRTFDSRGNQHVLHLDLEGWDNEPMMSPGVIEEDSWGNLPPGETFCCPAPMNASGEVCVNGSFPNAPLGLGQEVVLVFRDGRLQGYRGEPDSPGVLFLEQESHNAEMRGDDNWNMFAELGIGLNPKVVNLKGNSLIDEKAIRTIHIALGDNVCFGHDIEAAIHADLVSKDPSLMCDGEILLERGLLNREGLAKRRRIICDYSANLPIMGRMQLRGGTHAIRHGRLLRRLASANRVGYVEMADEATARRLARVGELLASERDLASFLRMHPEVDGISSTVLLGLLYHYRVLRITRSGRATN